MRALKATAWIVGGWVLATALVVLGAMVGYAGGPGVALCGIIVGLVATERGMRTW